MSKRPDWRAFTEDQGNAAKKRRRAGGWRAKKAGESAEELMMLVVQHYLKANCAELRKRPEPYRRVGAALSNGQFIAAPLAKSGPDFDLALPDGRSGLIELKSRKGKRVPLSAVGVVQGDALARRIAWRGFGIVMVMLWNEGVEARWWAVDWRRWLEARQRGYKSFSNEDLNRLGVPCPLMIGARPDWLPALLQADQEASEVDWPLDDSP